MANIGELTIGTRVCVPDGGKGAVGLVGWDDRDGDYNYVPWVWVIFDDGTEGSYHPDAIAFPFEPDWTLEDFE